MLIRARAIFDVGLFSLFAQAQLGWYLFLAAGFLGRGRLLEGASPPAEPSASATFAQRDCQSRLEQVVAAGLQHVRARRRPTPVRAPPGATASAPWRAARRSGRPPGRPAGSPPGAAPPPPARPRPPASWPGGRRAPVSAAACTRRRRSESRVASNAAVCAGVSRPGRPEEVLILLGHRLPRCAPDQRRRCDRPAGVQHVGELGLRVQDLDRPSTGRLRRFQRQVEGVRVVLGGRRRRHHVVAVVLQLGGQRQQRAHRRQEDGRRLPRARGTGPRGRRPGRRTAACGRPSSRPGRPPAGCRRPRRSSARRPRSAGPTCGTSRSASRRRGRRTGSAPASCPVICRTIAGVGAGIVLVAGQHDAGRVRHPGFAQVGDPLVHGGDDVRHPAARRVQCGLPGRGLHDCGCRRRSARRRSPRRRCSATGRRRCRRRTPPAGPPGRPAPADSRRCSRPPTAAARRRPRSRRTGSAPPAWSGTACRSG